MLLSIDGFLKPRDEIIFMSIDTSRTISPIKNIFFTGNCWVIVTTYNLCWY